MSQFFISVPGGIPGIPTSFQTDNGTATPLANTLIIDGKDSTENNDNGITTKGGVVGTGTANEVDVVLTNRATGQVNTSDATETTIISFSLGSTPGVYIFEGSIIAFNLTDVAGAAYSFSSGVRTDGATGTEIATQFSDEFEEPAMNTSDVDVDVSGNNLLVKVTGIAGKTIHWNSNFLYRFIS